MLNQQSQKSYRRINTMLNIVFPRGVIHNHRVPHPEPGQQAKKRGSPEGITKRGHTQRAFFSTALSWLHRENSNSRVCLILGVFLSAPWMVRRQIYTQSAVHKHDSCTRGTRSRGDGDRCAKHPNAASIDRTRSRDTRKRRKSLDACIHRQETYDVYHAGKAARPLGVFSQMCHTQLPNSWR